MSDHNYFANLIVAETFKPDAPRSATERAVVPLEERYAGPIADTFGGKIKMPGVGDPSDVVADNGSETKLPK